MALPDDLRIQDESSNLGGIPGMANNSPSDFEFIPAQDFFAPASEGFYKSLDPELQKTIDGWAENVNRFAIQPVGNLNTPYPTEATDTFNPLAQQSPIDLSTAEGGQRGLEALINQSKDLSKDAPEKPFIADPLYASRKGTRFDRYYNHPEFARLGFNPYSNNEEFYNANSTIWDDMSRMFSVFGAQVSSGFMSNYRSVADLAQDGNYFTNPDLLTSLEFEEALDIGMTSREGGLAFTNNLILQTGYTFGIIGSIALEEMALAGLEAVTFGGASPLVAAKTALNIGRLGRTLANTFDITRLAKASRNMLKTFNSADKARDFWTATKAGRQFATDLFAPETAAVIRNWKTLQHSGQNLSNLGKSAKAFGGFYRDLRAVNIALAESKLEAGMVFNQQIGNGIASYEARGLEVDADAMKEIKNAASEASFHTVIRNAPLIYLTNQFVLGNALPGFNKTLTRAMGDSVRGAGRRIIKSTKTIGADGKIARDVFEKVGTGFKGYMQRLKAAGARGSIKGIGQASLRYFAANVSEGIQELGQEAIAVGTKNYWTGLLEDPMAGGIELHRAAVGSAIDSQMSGQGFETFMSGFLMGGIVQGPQKLFFQGVPALYQQRSSKSREAYEKHKQRREDMIDKVVETHNNAWNRMADSMDNTMWDSSKLNFLVQKEAAKDMEQAIENDDMFGFMDAKDFSKFHHMATIFENGTQGYFRDQIKDLLQLTDEELLQAFPNLPKSEAKSGKVRERLEKMLVEMDTFDDTYAKNKNNNPNKFDPSAFKKGTREYTEELLKYQAYEHARYLSMFTGTQFKRALERADSIYNELASDPILSKIAANDLTVLLDLKSIDKELEILTQELVTVDDKAIQKDKMNRIARLSAIREVLYAEENLNKDETFRKSKSNTKAQKIATLEKERDAKLAELMPEGSTKAEQTKRDNAIKAEYAKKIANVKKGDKKEKVDYPLAKLRKVLLDYVQYLAESKNSFIDNDRIEDVLKMIVDYRALKGRAAVYYKSIEYLANPARLDEIAERQYEIFKNQLKNAKKSYRDLIDKYTLTIEQNELLNALNALTPSVFADPTEAAAFFETGNVDALMTFFTEDDIITVDNNPELFGEIQSILNTYREAVQRDEQKTDTTEDTTEKESDIDADLDAMFDGIDLEGAPDSKTQTSKKEENPEVKKLLEKLHREYNAKQTSLGKAPVTFNTFLQSKQAKMVNTAYEGLKKMWWKNVLAKNTNEAAATEMYKNDEGFIAWLKTQEESPNVYSILNNAGLDFSDFYEVVPTTSEELSDEEIDAATDEAKLGGKIIDGFKGKSYVIIESAVIDPISLKPSKVYVVKRKDGKELSDEIIDAFKIERNGVFLNIKDAKTLFDKLENAINPGDTFEFGGLTLSYGSIITDKKGNKYIVVSNKKMVQDYNNLMLVPEQIFNSGDTAKIKEAKNKKWTAKEIEAFKTEDLNFNVLPSNVSKLRFDGATKAQPYENKEQNETRESAQERMDAIFNNLTQEELDQLEIVVTENPNGGVVTENFKYEDKEANPYIKRRTQLYTIAVRLVDSNTIRKVNKALKEKGIPEMTEESNGVIAFLPNYDTVIEIDGEIIDPRFITIDQAKNVFFKSNMITDQQFVNNIQQSYGMAAAFMNLIAKNKKEGEPLVLNLNDLEGYSLKATSTFKPNAPIKPTSDLQYKTVDGNIVILDNRVKVINGKVIGRQKEFITDVSNPLEKVKFQKKVEQEMRAQGVYDQARNAGAYVLVIKNSLGQYTYTDLKATSLTDEARTELFKTLYNRAIETIEKNLTVEAENYAKAKIKDPSFNVEWNEDFQDSFYISLNPGYTMDIKVSLSGKIEVQVYDNVSNVKLLVNKKGQSNPIRLTQNEIKSFSEKDIENGALEQAIINAIQNEPALKQALPAKFGVLNFRESFATDTKAQDIINTTETTLDDRVNFDYKLRINAPADMTQAVTDVPAQTSTSASQKVDDSDQNLADLIDDTDVQKADIERRRQEDLNIGIPINNYVSGEIGSKNQLIKFRTYLTDVLGWEKMPIGFSNKQLTLDYLGTELRIPAELIELGGGVASLGIDIKDVINAKYDAELAALDSQQVGKQLDHSARIAELKKLIADRKAEIIAEFKDLSIEDKKTKPLSRLLSGDKTLTDLQSELNDLNKLANKIVDPAMTYDDIVDIDAFKEWAKINLPDFITIKDIQVLGNNMLRGGVRVGAFGLALNSIAGGLNIEGTIYTGAANPFKYHEAFHAVFRLLLTDEQIDTYTRLAKKEVKELLRSEKGYEVLPGVFTNSLAEAKEILRNSSDDYAEMSDARIEQELYEEYMANEFELFKQNRKSSKTDSKIKSFFNRIIEWIRSFFTSYSKNELTKLYENIDAGKFKSSEAVVNRFTNSHVKGVTIANALIPYERIEGSRTEGFLFLNGNQSTQLINNAAAIYVNRLQTRELVGKSRKDILDEVIDDFAALYSTSNPINYDLTVEQFTELLKYEEAFLKYRDKIAEAISTKLELVDISIDEKEFTEEEIEDEQGLRNTQEWDKDASLTGGFSSLSSKLRKYIMTTSLPVSQTDAGADVFGHTELTEGEPLINAVDFSAAYNGLLKATANTTDANTMLQKMYLFSQNNPETEAVIIKFFTDIGILKSEVDVDPSTQLKNLMANITDLKGQVTRPLFFNAMIKGFQNFRIDYLFIHRNTSDGTVYTYSASLRDDANSQIDVWAQHYSDIFSTKLEKDPAKVEEAVEALTLLKAYVSGETINPKGKDKYSYGKTEAEADAKLNQESRELSNLLRTTLGITLSPQYIAYNIIQRLSAPTTTQRIIKDTNEDARLISGEDVEVMINIVGANLNLFGDKEGATTKLKELSMGNAVFDETIGTSVFKNPNGDLVYAHQLPTFHLQAIHELNNSNTLELKRSDEYLINNLLLNSEAFNSLSEQGKLQILRIAGAKAGKIDIEGGDAVSEGVNQQGKTYGDFTAKEFITNILNAYTANYNRAKVKNNGVVTIENEDGTVTREALAPVLIRVIEASNTGDMVSLPVIKAVMQTSEGIKLTDQAINAYVNEIKAEFERIKRELNPETATYNTETGEGTLYAGYNADKMGQSPNPNGRAFTFAKTGDILKDTTEKETFKKDATAGTSAEQLARIKEGNQKALVYEKDKANLVFSQVGDSRRTIISAKGQKVGFQTTLLNRGLIKVTLDNIDEMLDLFGEAVSVEKTDKYKYKINQGNFEGYTEGLNLAQFLSGQKELVLFEIQGGEIDKTETLEESRAEETIQTSEVEKVTEGVEELFDSKSELASIGTPEQYSAYLDTIFPDSEVKDIIYHGSPNTFEVFNKLAEEIISSTEAFADHYFFTSSRQVAQEYVDQSTPRGEMYKGTEKLYSVLINAKNLKKIDFEGASWKGDFYEVRDLRKPNSRPKRFAYEQDATDYTKYDPNRYEITKKSISELNTDEFSEQAKKEGYDSSVVENVQELNSVADTYAVFNPEQIHILGSKQDIEGFKEFVQNTTQPTVQSTEEESYTPVSITKKNYTREQVKNSPNTAFVFTENNYSITAFPNRQGGGSAVIRPEENAFAIVTKKKYDYDTRENVDYADTEEDFAEFVEVNTRLINELKESGKSEIVFPKGFATDKAKMPTRFAEWLQGQLRDNFGLVTELNKAKTGLISKSVDDAVSKVIVQEEVVEELNDYEAQLLSALQLNSEISFEDAIGDMAAFEEFLQKRLNKEFLEFEKVLRQELGKEATASFDISKDIREGLKNKAGEETDASRIAAKQLNLTNDVNFNLRQIFFNNWLNSSALNDLILGDQAISLKDAVDAVKRAKMQNASGYGADTIINAPEYGVEHAVDRMDMFLFTDPMAPSKYGSNANIEVADGQTYGTVKAFRYLWFGFGKLTKDQANLLDKVDAGEAVSYEELLEQVDENTESYAKLKAMINSKKIVYGDGKVFQKTSLFTLTKGYTSKKVNGEWVARPGREHLHNLREKMEAYEEKMWEQGEGTLAFAAPTSASKMMKYNVTPLETMMDATTELTEDNSMQLSAKYMRLQVINPSNKLTITDPTQIKSIVTSEQNDDAEVFINGKKTTLGQVRAAYNKALIQRGDLKYTNKRNLIFNFDAEYASDLLRQSVKEGELNPDLFVYLRYASEGLKASQATSNILEMFSTDENGNQKYNLNNPQTVRKFEELFLSFFSKGVFSEKTTGMSVALASDFGVGIIRRVFSVDENGLPDKHEIIRSDVYETMQNPPAIMFNINQGTIIGDDSNLEGLAAAVEAAGSEGVVIMDRLRSDMKEYDSKGNYTNQKYSESMIPAHHVSVGNELAKTNKAIPDVVAKMFGVRIPSQDNHSTINIKLVDFLPGEYGSTGIFPRELVEVSGADFDIDKLYIQTKKFYEQNGEFFEYGKATSENGQFSDYVRYVNAAVNESGSDIAEAFMKYKHSGSIIGLSDADIKKLRILGYSDKAIKALSATHLPKTKEQYKDYKKKYGEPYTYALDNDALDYKFALMGNEDNTTSKNGEVPLSYEPADLQPLFDVFNELADDETGLPYFQKFKNEGGNSVDSPLGQMLAFKNNKEGAASIGAVVLPNLYLNLFQEYGVSVKRQNVNGQTASAVLRLNGQDFTEFATLREQLPNGTEGNRTQYVISALITAMTDNAKERMAAKLGLNKSALATVANMVALGVPLKTSVLLINNPVIKELYYFATNKESEFDPGIKTLVKNTMREIILSLPEEYQSYEVTDALLSQQIQDGIDLVNSEVTLSILEQFLTALEISEYTGKVSSIMNLSSGLGRNIRDIKNKMDDINDLGLRLNAEDYKDYEKIRFNKKLPLIDIRPILKGTWQGANVKRLIEIHDKILPSVFLSETKPFDFIYQKVSTSLNHDGKGITKDQLILDLMSYLTIKGYQFNQLNSETSTNKKYMGSLSTSYLYPQLEGDKITNVISRLKDSEAAKGESNFFLTRFAIAEAADEINNKDGIYKVNSNTFNRISDNQKIELQTSFARLYLNFDTRDDALALVHYAMLKDGFQFGYQSILDAITPVVYDSFLGHIDTIHKAFKEKTSNDKIFQGTFGLTFNELVDDFTNNYLMASRVATNRIGNITFLKRLNFNARFIGGVDRGVEVGTFTFNEVKENTDTLYVFPDNAMESGYDGPRNVRELPNAIGFPAMKDNFNNDKSGFKNEDLALVQELTKKFKEEFAEKAEGKNVVFHNTLFYKKESERLNKEAKDVYEEFKGVLTTLGYNLEAGTSGSGTVKTKRGLKNKITYIDETGPVAKFIVNLYPKEDPVKTDNASEIRNPKGGLKDITNTEKKYMRGSNLEIYEDKNVNNVLYRYALLPQAINVSMGKGNPSRYFILTKVQNAGSNTPISEQKQIQGNYAEYTEFNPVGSRGVNPVAFIGGEQPTYQEVKEYVANAQDPIDFAEIDDVDFDFLDAAIDAKANIIEQTAQNPNSTIEATNGEVKVNGKNMADITEQDVPETTVDVDAELTDQEFDETVTDRLPGEDEIDLEAAQKAQGALANLFGTPNITPAEQQITDFYDNFIDKSSFPELKKKYLQALADAGINSLDELIETFNQTNKTADEFIEEVKQCILNIK